MRVLAMAICVLLALASGALAQDTVDVRGIGPGTIIKTRMQSGQVIEGRLLWARKDTALVGSVSESRAIPLVLVDSLWVQGTHVRSGTIAGAAVGAAIGIAFAFVAARGSCDYGQSCTGGYFVALPLGAAIFALPGALLGSLVGSLTPRWVLHSP